MRVVNTTKKALIADAIVARSLWSHFVGLRFRKKAAPMLFILPWKQKLYLDMFFVPFPIDVVYIEAGTVVELKKNLRPWRMYRNRKKANYILELPAGEIAKKKIAVGDAISLS